MDPRLRNLVWQECHQRRTQFVVCLLWMAGGAVYAVAHGLAQGFWTPIADFFFASGLYAFFMPIFPAMRTSLGEVTERTRSFSDALPIAPWQRASIRLAGGAAVLVVPLLLCAILLSTCLALGWLDQVKFEPDLSGKWPEKPASLSLLSAVGQVWCAATFVAWFAIGVYLLLSLLGTALRAESHLGYWGPAVLLLLIFVISAPVSAPMSTWYHAMVSLPVQIQFRSVEVGGDVRAETIYVAPAQPGPVALSVAIQSALALLFVRRYGRKPRVLRVTRTKPALRRARWIPRLPPRGVALVWLACRQSVPMCLPGLLIACVMTFFDLGLGFYPGDRLLGLYSERLPHSMAAAGLLWSVVVAAGMFAPEIDGRIAEFWRTLPIPAFRLFAVKFVVGLLVVLLVLDGLTVAVAWSFPHWKQMHRVNWPYIECIVPLHAAMFATAVAWTCLLRRAVLGAAAAIVTFGILLLAIAMSGFASGFNLLAVYNHVDRAALEATHGFIHDPVMGDLNHYQYPLVAVTIGVVVAASFVAAWHWFRRYDPRRQTD